MHQWLVVLANCEWECINKEIFPFNKMPIMCCGYIDEILIFCEFLIVLCYGINLLTVVLCGRYHSITRENTFCYFSILNNFWALWHKWSMNKKETLLLEVLIYFLKAWYFWHLYLTCSKIELCLVYWPFSPMQFTTFSI